MCIADKTFPRYSFGLYKNVQACFVEKQFFFQQAIMMPDAESEARMNVHIIHLYMGDRREVYSLFFTICAIVESLCYSEAELILVTGRRSVTFGVGRLI